MSCQGSTLPLHLFFPSIGPSNRTAWHEEMFSTFEAGSHGSKAMITLPKTNSQNTPLKNSGKRGRLLPFPFLGRFGPFSGASAVGRVGSKNGVSASEEFLPGFDAAKKKKQQIFPFFFGGAPGIWVNQSLPYYPWWVERDAPGFMGYK